MKFRIGNVPDRVVDSSLRFAAFGIIDHDSIKTILNNSLLDNRCTPPYFYRLICIVTIH